MSKNHSKYVQHWCGTEECDHPYFPIGRAQTTGKEVILKWKPTDNKKRKAAAGTNAFDQIAQQDKRQRRAMAKGAGA